MHITKVIITIVIMATALAMGYRVLLKRPSSTVQAPVATKPQQLPVSKPDMPIDYAKLVDERNATITALKIKIQDLENQAKAKSNSAVAEAKKDEGTRISLLSQENATLNAEVLRLKDLLSSAGTCDAGEKAYQERLKAVQERRTFILYP